MEKIYLAGSCSSDKRTMMQTVAKALRNEGFEVYCPFELKISNAWDMSQEEWGRRVFHKDLEALDACDIFLMITPGRHSTAGTNWEQGYAYAKGKKIIVVQYTNNDTSLMTYSSANQFIQIGEIREDNLPEAVMMGLFHKNKHRCDTVLT